MATVLVRDQKYLDVSESEISVDSVPPLGAPVTEKTHLFQRGKGFDADAIATQVSDLGSATLLVLASNVICTGQRF